MVPYREECLTVRLPGHNGVPRAGFEPAFLRVGLRRQGAQKDECTSEWGEHKAFVRGQVSNLVLSRAVRVGSPRRDAQNWRRGAGRAMI